MTSAPLTALAQANRVREIRAAQRDELRGVAAEVLVSTLLDPPAELASYRLRDLFATEAGARGVIPRFGRVGLGRALQRYNGREGNFRAIHSSLRLRDLTKRERQEVAKAIVAVAPESWKQRTA